MAEHMTLQSADMIEEVVSAVDAASDELRRLSLEVSRSGDALFEWKRCSSYRSRFSTTRRQFL